MQKFSASSLINSRARLSASRPFFLAYSPLCFLAHFAVIWATLHTDSARVRAREALRTAFPAALATARAAAGASYCPTIPNKARKNNRSVCFNFIVLSAASNCSIENSRTAFRNTRSTRSSSAEPYNINLLPDYRCLSRVVKHCSTNTFLAPTADS